MPSLWVVYIYMHLTYKYYLFILFKNTDFPKIVISFCMPFLQARSIYSVLGLLLLNLDLSLAVDDSDVQLRGSLYDGSSLSGGEVGSKLSSESSVVHQQELDFLGVLDVEGLEAGSSHESGGFVSTITDVTDGLVSSESSSHSAIDTVGLSPLVGDGDEVLALESSEFLYSLLKNLLVLQSFDGHCCILKGEKIIKIMVFFCLFW